MKIFSEFVFLFICIPAISNIFPNDTWESGLVDLGNGNDMFYVYFKARYPEKGRRTPIILWLTGGPGCSGLFALYLENGPNIILPDGSYKFNPYSWNNNSDLIYVDSPIGTGFSRVASKSYLCHEENCVSRYLYLFLIKLYNKHPDLSPRPLYIFGESYGGHYVPSISEYLIRANNPLFNFQGYAVGNGLTDAYHQLGVYPSFLHENKKISFFKFITSQVYSFTCVADLLIRPYNQSTICLNYLNYLQKIGKFVNVNNIKLNYKYDDHINKMIIYVNQPEVLKEFGVPDKPWIPCNGDTYHAFDDDIFRSYKSSVEYSLQKNYKVLIYAGELDFICNWKSNNHFLKFLNWKYKKEFNKQKLRPWIVGKKEAGQIRSYAQLSFIKIYQSGHFAPMDKPAELLFMVNNFTEAI